MNQPANPNPDSPSPLEEIPKGMSHREYWKRFTQQAAEAGQAQPEQAAQPDPPVQTAQPVPPVHQVQPEGEVQMVQPVFPSQEDRFTQQSQQMQQTQLAQQTQIAQLALQAQLTQQALLNQLAAQQAQFDQQTQPTHKGEKSGMDNSPSHEAHNQAGPEPSSSRPLQRQKFNVRDLKFGPPFWTITGFLSLIVNVVLIVIVVNLASQIFSLKNTLENQLLGGLYHNFVAMDEAHIRTSIPVSTNVPAKFNLALNTETTVILKKAVLIKGAKVVSLVSGGMSIYNAPADIVLPVGTELPIQLNLTVPVDQQIPVNLTVNVDIPLNQTDLHAPFTGLQNVVLPYYEMLKSSPNTLQEAVCGKEGSDLCNSIIP
jgi:hypothetical protein